MKKRNDDLDSILSSYKYAKFKSKPKKIEKVSEPIVFSIEHQSRISKDRYYLEIAKAVSLRSTCLRRKYGAIIVKNDLIVATGYNGAPRGKVNCCDIGKCVRIEQNIPHGERYELCRSVHAEQNAIISAGFEKSNGATLYLSGVDGLSETPIDAPDCCMMCKRVIINAGIYKVIFLNGDGSIRETLVSSWIHEEDET